MVKHIKLKKGIAVYSITWLFLYIHILLKIRELRTTLPHKK
ncbi:hypothetical protein BACEGG_01228 [Bacteroides eggerthii DSM 20697]|nr:hypothetical protein BACEGG_01228 [Bacteroides eggerthii DSM 20697]